MEIGSLTFLSIWWETKIHTQNSVVSSVEWATKEGNFMGPAIPDDGFSKAYRSSVCYHLMLQS